MHLDDDSFAVDTSLCFGFAPSGGIYGLIGEAGVNILRFSGIGPIARWVDDHILFRIRCEHLSAFNESRAHLAYLIHNGQGYTTHGGRSWFTGTLLPGGTWEEFDENLSFPIKDLSLASPRSDHDQRFTYNLDNVNAITNSLGILWKASKDIPFSSSPTFIRLAWDLKACTVTLTETKHLKYLAALAR